MKIPHLVRFAGVLLATLLISCQNARISRIQEHASVFASLPPETQQIIRDGLFDRGFSPEQIYMALGKPNRAEAKETTDGTVMVWKYRNFVYGNIGAMKLSANTPGSKAYGPILSSSAPGGPSLFSTKSGPMQPTISDGSDAPVGTLYIEFLNGVVVAARIDP
jgi:hypothetical protein